MQICVCSFVLVNKIFVQGGTLMCLSVNVAGNMLRAAESALKLERERLQKLKELEEINQSLRSSSNQVCLISTYI